MTLRVSNSAGHDQTTKIVPVITGPRDDSYSGTEDITLVVDAAYGVLANDSAPAPLTATVDQKPTGGTLTLNADGSFSYTPDVNFCGTDGFSYLLHDGAGQTHQATVALDVACVNDPPVAAEHSFDVTEDAVQQVAAPGLLAGATDPDTGDTLTARLSSHPAHGSLDVHADGSFTYAPDANYCGADEFGYEASDGHATSNTATVTLNVKCVNDVPNAVDDHYRVTPGGTLAVNAAHGVLANDADVEDGTASTATLDEGAAHGTLNLAVDGSFSYVPDAGFEGDDTFSYFPGDGTDMAPNPAAVTIRVRPGGGPPSGGGGSGGTSGETPSSPAGSTTTVEPGGTASSDPGVTHPSPSDPVIATVTSPNGGIISFGASSGSSAPGDYSPLYTAKITAPPATVKNPLTLTFRIGSSALPQGVPPEQVTMFRDGTAIPACAGADRTATPDPCVSTQDFHGGVLTIIVLSSHASTWVAAIAPVIRVAGRDRIGTAIAASGAAFPDDHTAKAAVLARADEFSDALVGGPLAAAEHGPLLLTDPGRIDSRVAVELRRVLPRGGTVYVLGGRSALSPAVADRLRRLGYSVVRYGGRNRYATAKILAVEGLDSPSTVFEATGANFPDALSAAPAATARHAAILLTRGNRQAKATASYLRAHAGAVRFAVGGPAAHADPAATALVGPNRYATAATVARRLFPAPTQLAFASGADFPDALSGGAAAASAGVPMVLVPPRGHLGPAVSGYLSAVAPTALAGLLYGGPGAVTAGVAGELAASLTR